jgi:anti-sigma factor RsiW
MSACGFSQELLFAWMDGEAGSRAVMVEEHLRACPSCTAEVRRGKESAQSLRDIVDAAVGDVDPLVALRGIRARLEAKKASSPLGRLGRMWEDVWAYHRRAAAGIMVAAALGALTAPAVIMWAQNAVDTGGAGASLASVVIESMEWEANAQTAVYTTEGSSLTLIWVEPDSDHGTP